MIDPLLPSDSGTEKIILEDLFSSVLSKKYHPSRNLKFFNLGIFQSLKLRILMEKILPISLKINFTPNTLGCYGLSEKIRINSKIVQQGIWCHNWLGFPRLMTIYTEFSLTSNG